MYACNNSQYLLNCESIELGADYIESVNLQMRNVNVKLETMFPSFLPSYSIRSRVNDIDLCTHKHKHVDYATKAFSSVWEGGNVNRKKRGKEKQETV